MKKFLIYTIAFCLIVSAFVFPMTFKTAEAATITINCYAVCQGTVLDSATFSEYGFTNYVDYSDVMSFCQGEFESSYYFEPLAKTAYADFYTLYSDGSASNVISPTSTLTSGSSVYVNYILPKDITVYQMDVNGGQIGTYTLPNVRYAQDILSTYVPENLEPVFTFAVNTIDTNFTQLDSSNVQTAYNRGYFYTYYTRNTLASYFSVIDGVQTQIYNTYLSNGQPTTPNSSAVNSAIPQGYRLDGWYYDSSLTQPVTSFPSASGVSMDFYAKIVQDIPVYTYTVILSLNNNFTQSYTSYTFEAGQTVTITTPTYNNYTFVSYHSGYPCNESNLINSLGTATANTVVYALMRPNTVAVQIYWTDSLDGSPYLAHTFSIPYNRTPNVLQYTTREGYALIKITSDPAGQNVVTSYGPLTQNTTWYAFFSQSVTVTYWTRTVNGGSAEFYTSMSAPVGVRAPSVPIPEIENYRFVGYSTSENGAILSELPTVTEPMNIYLVYTYSVGEGGTFYIYTVTFTLGKDYTASSGDRYISSMDELNKIKYNEVITSFGIVINDQINYNAIVTPLPDIQTSFVLKNVGANSVGYNSVVSLDFYNKTSYTFKFLSFSPIDYSTVDRQFYLKFDFKTSNVANNFSVSFACPTSDIVVTEQEFTLDSTSGYIISTPDNTLDLLGKSAGSIFGMFFNSVGRFLGDLLSYNLFGVLPLWTLVIVPIVLGLVVIVIKAFL